MSGVGWSVVRRRDGTLGVELTPFATWDGGEVLENHASRETAQERKGLIERAEREGARQARSQGELWVGGE